MTWVIELSGGWTARDQGDGIRTGCDLCQGSFDSQQQHSLQLDSITTTPSLSSWLPSFRTESPGKGWALCSVCSQLWVDTGTSTLAWFWKYNFKIPLLTGKLLRKFFSCPLLPLTINLRFRVKRCFQFTDGKGGLRSIWAVCSLLHSARNYSRTWVILSLADGRVLLPWQSQSQITSLSLLSPSPFPYWDLKSKPLVGPQKGEIRNEYWL